MASTPHRSWAGCSAFGIRDFFEGAPARPELVPAAIQAANLALEDLGISSFRIETITKQTQRKPDVDEYEVTLITTRGEKLAFPLSER